jgi:hypothetical protein
MLTDRQMKDLHYMSFLFVVRRSHKKRQLFQILGVLRALLICAELRQGQAKAHANKITDRARSNSSET